MSFDNSMLMTTFATYCHFDLAPSPHLFIVLMQTICMSNRIALILCVLENTDHIFHGRKLLHIMNTHVCLQLLVCKCCHSLFVSLTFYLKIPQSIISSLMIDNVCAQKMVFCPLCLLFSNYHIKKQTVIVSCHQHILKSYVSWVHFFPIVLSFC